MLPCILNVFLEKLITKWHLYGKIFSLYFRDFRKTSCAQWSQLKIIENEKKYYIFLYVYMFIYVYILYTFDFLQFMSSLKCKFCDCYFILFNTLWQSIVKPEAIDQRCCKNACKIRRKTHISKLLFS